MLMLHFFISIAVFRAPVTYADETIHHEPCRCKGGQTFNNSKLHCRSGCQPGWTGPGCQVGNIIAGTTCSQSSTYCSYDTRTSDERCLFEATNAVDGRMPLDDTEKYCSHTASQAYPWWYATFNDTMQHVIENITITNRIGNYSSRLHDFYVLVTNSTHGHPHPSNWSVCAYHPGVLLYNSTFSCSGAIGRRVAVYLNSSSEYLTLCEVTAIGYSYKECPPEMTGPGCLLHSCDSEACLAANGTCVSNYCHFSACPEKRHWPPECWIKMPALSNNSNVTCNYSSTVNITLPQLGEGQLSSMSTRRVAIKVQDLASKYQHSLSFVYPADYNCSSLFFANSSWVDKVVFSPEVCLGNVCHYGPDYILALKWKSDQNQEAMTPAIAGAGAGAFVLIATVVVVCVLVKDRSKQTKPIPRAKVARRITAQETDCELSTYTSLEQRMPPTYALLEKKLKDPDNQVYSSVYN